MNILKISAFTDGNSGGNPAGVWIGETLPNEIEMQAIAAEIGFSETVFACPTTNGWRVRYFSPKFEVPFCGHATIALGAATAALAGYLRDIGWPHGGAIDVVQGEDMGLRSCIKAEISPVPGDSIRVSGTARIMKD